MKKVMLTSFAFLCLAFTIAQTPPSLNDCNSIFDKVVLTKITTYDRNTFKQYLYNYLLATSEERKELKKQSSTDASLGIVIDAIPMNGNYASSKESNSSFLSKLYTEIKQRGYVIDEEVNTFISEFYQQGVFDSYKTCLEETGKVLLNSNGVYAFITGDLNSSFILQVSFTNKLGVEHLTVLKAVFDGANVKYGNTFANGTQIKNNQSLYQHLERIPGKPLNISIAFDKSDGINKTFPAKVNYDFQTSIPIGSIIYSILDYSSFLDVNNDKQTNFDIEKSTWVPCDGRVVTGSAYGRKQSNVPDLRGVFLRGINDMGVPGVLPVNPNQANTENYVAGQLQLDEFKSHTHAQVYAGGNNKTTNYSQSGIHGQLPEHLGTTQTGPSGSNETRPKNITVYCYIKIN